MKILKVGDLVQVKDLSTSGIGVIVKSRYEFPAWMFTVLFSTLGYYQNLMKASSGFINEREL